LLKEGWHTAVKAMLKDFQQWLITWLITLLPHAQPNRPSRCKRLEGAGFAEEFPEGLVHVSFICLVQAEYQTPNAGGGAEGASKSGDSWMNYSFL